MFITCSKLCLSICADSSLESRHFLFPSTTISRPAQGLRILSLWATECVYLYLFSSSWCWDEMIALTHCSRYCLLGWTEHFVSWSNSEDFTLWADVVLSENCCGWSLVESVSGSWADHFSFSQLWLRSGFRRCFGKVWGCGWKWCFAWAYLGVFLSESQCTIYWWFRTALWFIWND